jgi:hypothetical protein
LFFKKKESGVKKKQRSSGMRVNKANCNRRKQQTKMKEIEKDKEVQGRKDREAETEKQLTLLS